MISLNPTAQNGWNDDLCISWMPFASFNVHIFLFFQMEKGNFTQVFSKNWQTLDKKPIQVNVGWIHQPSGYNGQQAGTNSVDTPNPPWKCSKSGSFLASPGCPGSVRPMLGLAQCGALAAPALQQWSSTTGLALRETSPSNLLQQNHTHNPPSSGDQGFQARLEVQHQFSTTQKWTCCTWRKPGLWAVRGTSFLPGISSRLQAQSVCLTQ